MARYLCRLAPRDCATPLYAGTNLEKAEIDHWLEYSVTALSQHQGATPTSALERLDSVLGPRVYLVGYGVTLADLAVYSAVRGKCASSEAIDFQCYLHRLGSGEGINKVIGS